MNINSESLIIRTNKLPSGGLCIIQNILNLQPLDYYNVFCTQWINQIKLEGGFVEDARELNSRAAVGDVSVTICDYK